LEDKEDRSRAEMLIPVFGTPSALTVWMVHFANVVLDIIAGDHHYVAAVFLSDVRDLWVQRRGRPVVFHSDVPEQAIVSLFLNSRTPMLLACDDPLDSIGFAMAARTIDFRQAIRFVSQSYSTLADLFCAPKAAIVGPEDMEQTLSDFTSRFLDLFAIPATDLEKRQIVGRMLGDPDWERDETIRRNISRHVPLARPLGEFASSCTETERALAQGILDQYSLVAARKPIESLSWPPGILPDWDLLESGITGLTGFKGLLGRGRILTAGHALHLPRGNWRASTQISVRGNFSGNYIACDVLLGDNSLGGIVARLPEDGTFGFEFEFGIADAFQPAQFRLVLMEGAIEGELRIDSVRFDRIDETKAFRGEPSTLRR